MKVWYNKETISFDNFCSEQFLLLGDFEQSILQKNKDFANSQQWREDISRIVEYTSLEECDVIVFPTKLNHYIGEYCTIGKRYNKPVIAFYNDDNSKPIGLEGLVLFRTSFNKSARKQNEFSMPAWSADLLLDTVQIREKTKLPAIGFCGALTHSSRLESLQNILNAKQVVTNFIVRSQFWGGKIHDTTLRQEYISNTLKSDLVLCCRGAGNFSYRLYETLSLGRIPIIVDCDTPLPCSDVIDWNKFIVTTPENIVKDILTFWEKTDDEYKTLQLYAREVYEKFLCPSGFANYLNYHIQNGCSFY